MDILCDTLCVDHPRYDVEASRVSNANNKIVYVLIDRFACAHAFGENTVNCPHIRNYTYYTRYSWKYRDGDQYVEVIHLNFYQASRN